MVAPYLFGGHYKMTDLRMYYVTPALFLLDFILTKFTKKDNIIKRYI